MPVRSDNLCLQPIQGDSSNLCAKKSGHKSRWHQSAVSIARARAKTAKWHRENPDRLQEWKNNNPDRAAKHKRDTDLRRMGTTVEEFNRILAAQGGGCAICGCKEQASGRRLAVDHDHTCCPDSQYSCGKCIRGILCSSCNLMLGCSKDSTETLRKAIEYLSPNGPVR